MDTHFTSLRELMAREISEHVSVVGGQLGKQALDERVMTAMGRVPREAFVPPELQAYAYVDSPIPIGFGKTVSQPFMIALMADLLELGEGDRVLEVGTGLGYQAAILAELAGEVYTVEIIEDLNAAAARRLGELGCANVRMRVSDGYYGWPEHAPFDRIMVTAAAPSVPAALVDQLAAGGVLVTPIARSGGQRLIRVRRTENGSETEDLASVNFVPLV